MIYLEFDLLRKQDDRLLSFLVEYIMKKGEIEWFEVKKGLNKYQNRKLPKLISSLANRGGGIIFYGWDEKENDFSDIKTDYAQSIIVQQSKKCKPAIPLEFHIIKTGNNEGLFVGIPALNTPVKDENEKCYIRIGSHIRDITETELVNTIDQFKHKKQGHLYIENLIEKLHEVNRGYFCRQIESLSQNIEECENQLIKTINDFWKILFIEWLGESPYK
ncbi:unnamed protein product, partial [marine sediment metagenome]